MSFRYTKACLLQKSDIKVQIFHIRAHTKVFPYIMSYGGKFLKRFSTYLYCTKCNEIDICHLDVKKSLIPMKNGINSLYILYAGSYERIPMYQGQCAKNFKSAF